MSEIKPVTADQVYLAKAAGGDVELPKPVTANQMFLAKMAGMDVQTPPPVTADQMFMQKIIDSGGGVSGGVVVSNAQLAKSMDVLNEIENLTVSFPYAKAVNPDAFMECSSLKSISLPFATIVGLGAFENCVALEYVNLPSAEIIGEGAFAGCSSLNLIDLPSAKSVGRLAFDGCTNLSTIILRMYFEKFDITAIANTKIATADGVPTGDGFIYVHAQHYEQYVENFAQQAEQIVGDAATAEYIARAVLRKIEDYPEICG